MFTFVLKMVEDNLVELWNGKILMGIILPTDAGIKVVSEHLIGDPTEVVEIDSIAAQIPEISINLIRGD